MIYNKQHLTKDLEVISNDGISSIVEEGKAATYGKKIMALMVKNYKNHIYLWAKKSFEQRLFGTTFGCSLFLALVFAFGASQGWIETVMRREDIARFFIGYTLGAFFWTAFLLRKKNASLSDFVVFFRWIFFAALFVDLPMAMDQFYPTKPIKYAIFLGLIFWAILRNKEWDTPRENKIKKTLIFLFGVIVVGLFLDDRFYVVLDGFAKDFSGVIFCDETFSFFLEDYGRRRCFVFVFWFCLIFPFFWGLFLFCSKFFWEFKPQEQKLSRDIEQTIEKYNKACLDWTEKQFAEYIKENHPRLGSVLRNLLKNQADVETFEGKINMDREIAAAPNTYIFPYYVGRKEDGEDVYFDFGPRPHVLLHGTTGSGKSNQIEHYICCMLDRSNTLVYLADQGEDLYGYKWHERVRYAKEEGDILKMVEEVRSMIQQRAALFKKKRGVRKIEDWTDEGAPPRVFLIFDEFEDFCKDELVKERMVFIARKGRKYGIHLLLATQSSRADVFPSRIKDNTPSIAFRAETKAHAQVLGETKALAIPKESIGLAVIKGEFVQTPKADNRKFWREEEEEEGDKNQMQTLLPAEKGEMGAKFLGHQELKDRLRDEPEERGYTKTRAFLKGERKRGYWVKEEPKEPE